MAEYYSNGKLILMGEYAVMHGADAVCLPLKTGQKLITSPSNDQLIHWRWSYKTDILSSFSLEASTLQPIHSNKGDSSWSIRLLQLIRQFSPEFLTQGCNLEFINHFPAEWGLGSSSATISSLCRMAGVDPFDVNFSLMGGSGADIAATTAQRWFLYRKQQLKPQIWELPFIFPFVENTYFIYSGKKQATASHLISKNLKQDDPVWFSINPYIYRFIMASSLPEVMQIIHDHESIIAGAVNMSPIGDTFTDFPGKVKSLGAWGGDFFMAISQQNENFIKTYFQNKGYTKILNWKEMAEQEEF
jgi:mevalonate kinase